MTKSLFSSLKSPHILLYMKFIIYQRKFLKFTMHKIFFFKILFIHSWETQREREKETGKERERGRDTGRGRSRLHAGSPMWDLIPGPQDHTLGWRQALNRWASQGSQLTLLFHFESFKLLQNYLRRILCILSFLAFPAIDVEVWETYLRACSGVPGPLIRQVAGFSGLTSSMPGM